MEPPASAPEHPRARLGWPTVVIALATLLIGGFLGYAVGRPNTSPPVHGALKPGQVRVPDLRDLAAEDARAILSPLDLQVGAIGLRQSQDAPRGIVLEQDPGGGDAVPKGTTVDLVMSSGPGPGPGAMYEFARSVLLPLTHTGTYQWTSGRIALDGDAVSLGANTRVIGHAGVSPYRITMAGDDPGVTAVTVSVEVSSFTPPAWFVIERAFTRQRETPGVETTLRATPPTGQLGTEVTLEGRSCQAAPASTSVAVSAEFSRGGKPYATVPLPVRGSAYAFRMRFTVPATARTPAGTHDVHPGDRVVFAASGGACRSKPFRVT
jgi:hypothetical protein